MMSLAACGDEEDDPCDAFDLPQIWPDVNPVCLNYTPTPVGTPITRSILIDNRGRDDLQITSATLVDETNGDFTLQGINKQTIACGEDPAAAQVVFQPSGPGWAAATVVIESNAQNFVPLRVYFLGLGVPPNDPDYDPGRKPDSAFDEGIEACPPPDVNNAD